MANITEEERIEVFYNYLYGDTSGKIVLISNLIISKYGQNVWLPKKNTRYKRLFFACMVKTRTCSLSCCS